MGAQRDPQPTHMSEIVVPFADKTYYVVTSDYELVKVRSRFHSGAYPQYAQKWHNVGISSQVPTFLSNERAALSTLILSHYR